jgi:hypothetical protein
VSVMVTRADLWPMCSKLGLQTGSVRPDDSRIVLLFVVGGITCSELDQLSALFAQQTKVNVNLDSVLVFCAVAFVSPAVFNPLQLLVGSTSILRPSSLTATVLCPPATSSD